MHNDVTISELRRKLPSHLLKTLVFDLEIKKAIRGKGEEFISGIEYCNGWGDKANMGISVLTAYSISADEYYIICDDNKDTLRNLCESHDFFVGHSALQFDVPVVALNWDIRIPEHKVYDTKVELAKAAPSGHKTGLSLDDVCGINFGIHKTGHGADAPKLWQQGCIGRVHDYCLNDTKMTAMLVMAMWTTTTVVHPVSKIPLPARIPM